jgi:outer membrane protein insertion porin family
VSITEINSDTGDEIDAGGNTMVLFNAEVLLPLVPRQGVQGVLFYDTGNVYGGDIDLSNLRQSAGIGIRWLTPIAPLQLVYGWILDRRDDEDSGRFEFSLGGSF